LTTLRAALRHDYLGDLDPLPPDSGAAVLGVTGFAAPPRVAAGRVPVALSGMPLLPGQGVIGELWSVESDGPARAAVARLGRVEHGQSRDFLFGCVAIEERSCDVGGAQDPLRSATELAYRDIFAVLAATGHRHLIRIWNHLADINEWSRGDERYRRFNRGRREAFERFGLPTEGTVPAACALGAPSGTPLSIHFLAGRQAPIPLENPRQLSAYHYPGQYGSHSPIFARACMLDGSSGTTLFISGTASIVGHESRHAGDVVAQTREALANIDALIEQANRRAGARRYERDALRLKVYVRRPEDLPLIDGAISAHIGAEPGRLYVRADICRRELLVEIEATGVASG
jgi:enamine deaminase RidA (YjgF/YER057c/UK114 family)